MEGSGEVGFCVRLRPDLGKVPRAPVPYHVTVNKKLLVALVICWDFHMLTNGNKGANCSLTKWRRERPISFLSKVLIFMFNVTWELFTRVR